MKKLLLLLLITILGVQTNAQFVNYERDGGWNLGFNMGGAWQRAEPFGDVKSKPYAGFSGGFTFGKSIYERPGSFLAFDIRFRYLRAKNYGWVGTPQYGSEFVDTARNVTFGFKNYKMDMNEFTLEGVITLHALRERTGIILYGFGGVGLVDYRVKTDRRTDEFGQSVLYDYSADSFSFTNVDTNQNATAIAAQLKDYSDRDFETTITGSQWSFMPSLGFGLGYQITPSFSMGVEHKITYALHDNLDGITNSGKNDNSHYTALVLRWNLLGRGETYKPNTNNNNPDDWTHKPNNTTTTTPVTQPSKPLVNIYNPANNNSVVHNSAYTIKAKIYNVASSSGVTFKQNGLVNSGFTYNPSNNEFSATVYLQPGSNSFEITGVNTAGSDKDSRIIIFKIPEEFTNAPAPIVTFTNPSSTSSTVSQQQYNVMATVLNVVGKNDITFTVNGISSTNFVYNTSNKVLTSSINLLEGNNSVTIKGVNGVGSDVKTVNINYVKPATIQPPVVTITKPGSSPYATNSPVELINATVLNVASKNDIKVQVNGANITNFLYDAYSKNVSFSTNLIVGANVVQITGTNTAGTDAKSTTLIYSVSEIMPPPVVDFTTPSISPFSTNQSNMTLKATVLNVTSKQYITVKVNGLSMLNFSYNSTTKEVEFNANLVTGNNVFNITATNSSGSDQDDQIIVKEMVQTILPPVVSISNPSVNPFNTTVSSQIINAKIMNVDNISGVSAKFNGTAISNFTFDPISDKFVYNAQLNPGANILEITGTNNAGTASKSTTIIYTLPNVECDKPIITVTQPTAATKATGSNPTTAITINTSNSKGSIIATIKNATSIDFKIDGQSSPGYNYNAAKNYFESFLHLKEGANTYQIIATNDCGTTIENITFIYSPKEVPCEKPVINFISPNTSPYNYTGPTNLSISASVIGVSTNTQIVGKLNNAPIKKVYDAATKTISANLVLTEGLNTFVLSATNDCGSSTTELVINYTKPVARPTVNINVPSPLPHTTTSNSVSVKAVVTNIDAASGIQVFLDGQAYSNFNYNNNNKQVSFNLNIAIGSHTVMVKATNAAGTAQDSGEIIIIEEVSNQCDDPTIMMSQPINPTKAASSGNPTISVTTTSNTASLTGIMANTTNVTLSANGQNSSGFTFSPSNGSFNSTVQLNVGVNTYQIVASNSCGSATASQTIVIEYEPEVIPCNEPTVVFLSPTGASHNTTNATQGVSVKIQNVASESSVFSKLNNAYVNQSFNAATGVLTLNLTLVVGSNELVVMAKNECGSAQAVMNFIYAVTQEEEHGTNGGSSDPTVTGTGTGGTTTGTGNGTISSGGGNKPGEGGSGGGSNMGTGTPPVSDGEKANTIDNQYNAEIQKADAFYNAKNYNAAVDSYTKAAKLKPNESYPKTKLQSIETIKKQEAAKALNDKNYKDQIDKGDLYFKAGKYSTAKTYYTKALGYDPNSTYAKGKLAEIENKLNTPAVITKPVDKPTNVIKPTNTTKPAKSGTQSGGTKSTTPTKTVVTPEKKVTTPEIKPTGGRNGS